MRINHNLTAMTAQRQLSINNLNGSKSMNKLSTGLRINSAADDAAGLAVSEKMRGQIRGLNQASRNAQDGISMIQTAEGALNESHDILQRMRELAVQASNDTYTDTDRGQIQKEVAALTTELTRIADDTEFNNQTLLDTDGNAKVIHVGANADQTISVTFNSATAADLGVDAVDISTQVGANGAITTIQTAIDDVSGERAQLGAYQNRLEHAIKNLDTSAENLQASESRIRDVDMAKEMMELTKNNILQQASQAMLAQANSQPQSILQLLR